MDESGSINPKMARKRLQDNMEYLLNIGNIWDGMVEGGIVEGSRESITQMEVERVIGQMKSRKADGLTKLVGEEIIYAAGQAWAKFYCFTATFLRKVS